MARVGDGRVVVPPVGWGASRVGEAEGDVLCGWEVAGETDLDVDRGFSSLETRRRLDAGKGAIRLG